MICTRCKTDKPNEAFGLNRSKASGYQSHCKQCDSERSKARALLRTPEDRARIAANNRAWEKANPEKRAAAVLKHAPKLRPVDPAKARARAAAWRKANPEKHKAANARRYERHKARFHANVAARRAHQKHAIPPWSDPEKIRAIYAEARQRNEAGEKVHVDHVIPLKNPLVCGLHTPDNLEIIPALDNWSKNNRHWPDMP